MKKSNDRKNTAPKLSLRTQALRPLDDRALHEVRGGGTATIGLPFWEKSMQN